MSRKPWLLYPLLIAMEKGHHVAMAWRAILCVSEAHANLPSKDWLCGFFQPWILRFVPSGMNSVIWQRLLKNEFCFHWRRKKIIYGTFLTKICWISKRTVLLLYPIRLKTPRDNCVLSIFLYNHSGSLWLNKSLHFSFLCLLYKLTPLSLCNVLLCSWQYSLFWSILCLIKYSHSSLF